jgi:hypothetical protein
MSEVASTEAKKEITIKSECSRKKFMLQEEFNQVEYIFKRNEYVK